MFLEVSGANMTLAPCTLNTTDILKSLLTILRLPTPPLNCVQLRPDIHYTLQMDINEHESKSYDYRSQCIFLILNK